MREWIEIARCDFTGRRIIPAENARVATIEVDGDALFGPWDVDAELDRLAFTIALRDHLTEWIAQQLRVADDPAPAEPPPAPAPIESPRVTAAPVPPEPAAAPEPEPAAEPEPAVGEADRGQATDTVIRRWNRQHRLTVLPVARQLPAWLRAEYERLDGAPPDEQARDRAARLDAPPAATAAGAGQDAAGPDQHDTADGHPPVGDPAAAHVQPIGDGQQPRPAGDGHAAAVAMAENMLTNRSTPKAVADATGLDVTEVRDIEAQLRKARGKR